MDNLEIVDILSKTASFKTEDIKTLISSLGLNNKEFSISNCQHILRSEISNKKNFPDAQQEYSFSK